MLLNWSYLGAALLLLLPPLPLAGKVRRYLFSLRPKAPPGLVQLLGAWQNWADLMRAGAGAYLLHEMAVRVVPGTLGAASKKLAVEAGVCAVAVLFQAVRVERNIQFVAPVFFLSGITVVLSGWTLGTFALFVAWVFMIGSGKPALLLPAMAVALGVGGYVFGLSLPVLMNCVLILLPLLLEFLFQKPLTFVASPPSIQTHTPTSQAPTKA